MAQVSMLTRAKKEERRKRRQAACSRLAIVSRSVPRPIRQFAATSKQKRRRTEGEDRHGDQTHTRTHRESGFDALPQPDGETRGETRFSLCTHTFQSHTHREKENEEDANGGRTHWMD